MVESIQEGVNNIFSERPASTSSFSTSSALSDAFLSSSKIPNMTESMQ